ncbi:hypothetical protein VNI00_004969 [Paramarasmius palmivorus]|uniref:Uncharacterized protein n=1 Tax=Paramarasmius palmivorus TaxID=297713 RepID=A0AAW0DE87_9AGAR
MSHNNTNACRYISPLTRADPYAAIAYANTGYAHSSPNSRHPTYSPSTQSTSGSMIVSGLSGYSYLPQPAYEPKSSAREPPFRPIVFTLERASCPGVDVNLAYIPMLADKNYTIGKPLIVGSRDRVLDVYGPDPTRQYAKLTIKIKWPGYPNDVGDKEFSTKRGSLDREYLLHYVLSAIRDYWNGIIAKGVKVARGFEAYRIGGGPLRLEDLVVTGLVHRGGQLWQPEIWFRQRC